MSFRAVLAACAAILVAACGGGGGGVSGGGSATSVPTSASIDSSDPNNGISTGVVPPGMRVLYVGFSYSGATAYLFRPTTLTARITGLEGRMPMCSIVSGTLPEGMALGPDCSISGTPTQGVGGPFTVRLGAEGVANTLDWNWGIEVRGPAVGYAMQPSGMAGSSFTSSPVPNGWSAAPGETVTYAVASGGLPPGLVLNPGTGAISGMLTTYDAYRFRVSAQVQSAGRTVLIPGYEYTITSLMPSFTYESQPVWPGVPFASRSLLRGTYRYAATGLPAGISIDPATGTISGTARNGDMIVAMVTAAATDSNGATYSITTPFIAGGLAPTDVQYPPGRGLVNQPLAPIAPDIMDRSGGRVTGIAYSYALDPRGQPLPSGLTLDPTTGVIAGTPTAPAGVQITVNVTMSLNGATWMQQANINIWIH